MAITEKISIQEKIAELERRILKLERRGQPIDPISPKARVHWDKMWEEFNSFFKEVFK